MCAYARARVLSVRGDSRRQRVATSAQGKPSLDDAVGEETYDLIRWQTAGELKHREVSVLRSCRDLPANFLTADGLRRTAQPRIGRADRRKSSRPSALGTSAHTAYTQLWAAEAAEA